MLSYGFEEDLGSEVVFWFDAGRTGVQGLQERCLSHPETARREVAIWHLPPFNTVLTFFAKEHAVHVRAKMKATVIGCVVACSPTLEESYQRATTQGPIRVRGFTRISRAGIPKRPLPNCQAGYVCFNNATVPRRPEAVGWAPLVGQAR